ncbi:uncharacterized protein LOC117512611 [Thalassophryne amazonica]|uniref:uncharacterized protein LOC117512611 n=1 Tax=Thalassophryne amazonica TaxID=390379 RepID=UPI001470B532|nr:uncharacterized protein LOC117512611 [Thalassophryne amazonica]
MLSTSKRVPSGSATILRRTSRMNCMSTSMVRRKAGVRKTATRGRGRVSSESPAPSSEPRSPTPTSEEAPEVVVDVTLPTVRLTPAVHSAQEECGGKKRRKKRPPVILPEETTAELAAWWQGAAGLYNRRALKYHDTEWKRAEITKKAEELGLTCEKLEQWMKGIRSRFGRRDPPHKSGSGINKGPTDHEKKIKTMFSFLQEHIYRQPGRQSIKFHSPSQTTEGSRHTSSSSSSEEEDSTGHSGGNQGLGESQSKGKGVKAGPGKAKSHSRKKTRHDCSGAGDAHYSSSASLDAALTRFLDAADKSTHQLAALTVPPTGYEGRVTTFLGLVKSTILHEVKEEDFMPFSLHMMSGINDWVQEKRQQDTYVQQQFPPQPPQPQPPGPSQGTTQPHWQTGLGYQNDGGYYHSQGNHYTPQRYPSEGQPVQGIQTPATQSTPWDSSTPGEAVKKEEA